MGKQLGIFFLLFSNFGFVVAGSFHSAFGVASADTIPSVKSTGRSLTDSLPCDECASHVPLAQNRKLEDLDSLSNLAISTGESGGHRTLEVGQLQVESLRSEIDTLQAEFHGKADSVTKLVRSGLEEIVLPPEYGSSFDQKVNIQSLEGVPDIEKPVTEVIGGNLTNGLPQMDDIAVLPDDVSGLAHDVGELSGDIKGVVEDAPGFTEQLTETLEEQASQIEGIKELQQQSAEIEQLKSQLIPGENQLSTHGKELIKIAGANHFGEHQEELTKAMELMSKLKKKYPSLRSVADIPKRKPNAMKGKPFIERLIPGAYFQYQQIGEHLVDVNPYLSYRVSGIFTYGAGWNHRFVIGAPAGKSRSEYVMFGPRSFIDFNIGLGFVGHIEAESMYTYVPPMTLKLQPDSRERQWVTSVMLGIKRQFSVYKGLRGTALMQYNLFDPLYRSPYLDRLNSRIGFEYTFRKKARKTSGS